MSGQDTKLPASRPASPWGSVGLPLYLKLGRGRTEQKTSVDSTTSTSTSNISNVPSSPSCLSSGRNDAINNAVHQEPVHRVPRMSDELALVLHHNVGSWLGLHDRLAISEVMSIVHTKQTRLHYPSSKLRDCHAIRLARGIRRGLYPRLDSIDLSGNSLHAPAAMSLCHSLQQHAASTIRLRHLDLGGGGNDVGEGGTVALARAIRAGVLKDLAFLSLAESCLGKKGLVDLALSIRDTGLYKLEHLDLSRNNSTAERRFQSAMEEVEGDMEAAASDSAKEEAAKAFRDAATFNPQAAETIARALPSLPSLKKLMLSGRWLGSEGGLCLAAAFQQGCCPGLEVLVLSRDDLGDVGVAALADAVASCLPHLTTLSLALNGIMPSGAYAVAKAIESHPSLSHLDLRSNDIQDAGLLGLANMACSTLQVLDCHHNSIGDSGLHSLSAAIKMRRLPALRELYLSKNDLRVTSRAALTVFATALMPARRDGLLPCPALRVLHMGENRFDASLLAPCLSHLHSLEELDLNGVPMGGSAPAAIITTMFTTTTTTTTTTTITTTTGPRCLRRLRLSRTGIGHAGTIALADAMRAGELSTLRELALAEDLITPQAAIYMARCLIEGCCPRLRRMDMRQNLLNDESAACLVKSLNRPGVLREVDVRGNVALTNRADKGMAKYLGAVRPQPFHYMVTNGAPAHPADSPLG